MNAIYISFGAIIIYSVNTFSAAKPFSGEDINFSDEKLRCMDSAEGSEYEKSNQNPYSNFYNKPHSRFEISEKHNRPFDYEKRSASDQLYDMNDASKYDYLQKRQVGVVYKDEKPIGILQPFQRSYRFIPIKEETSYDIEENQDVSYNIPRAAGLGKRESSESSKDTFQALDNNYPSILTNFKIGSKLDKKRNYDAFTDENVQDLKTTIRKLRSSNSHNTEQIEEELKNILDDMGLIDDEETHAEKREVIEDSKDDEGEPLVDDDGQSENDRNKRDETCASDDTKKDSHNNNVATKDLYIPDPKKSAISSETNSDLVRREVSSESTSETNRKKREKQDVPQGFNKEGAQLIEELKDSGDLMISGNKSPLASSNEISTRDTDSSKLSNRGDENDNYEKRVERQIQSKINSLKEEVKREIEALKKKKSVEEKERKKRQIVSNLVEEETEELNPVKNVDQEPKPLIRKKRSTTNRTLNEPTINSVQIHSRKKREASLSFSNANIRRNAQVPDTHNEKKYNPHQENSEEGGELLGDDFDEVSKRETYGTDHDYDDVNDDNFDGVLYDRNKRSYVLPNSDSDDGYYYRGNYFDYDGNERFKRQNNMNEDFRRNIDHRRFVAIPSYRLRQRLRRRINEDQSTNNRPQQLSDMSDLDLFGALPKSYNGELSRYKRVKRK